jgi:ABC-type bacteriocin/lantibiotic exporter with double-glycine peptidase domain
MKTILIVIALICIFGLSWVNLWFALVGFVIIALMMCCALFVHANEIGKQQDDIMKNSTI